MKQKNLFLSFLLLNVEKVHKIFYVFFGQNVFWKDLEYISNSGYIEFYKWDWAVDI